MTYNLTPYARVFLCAADRFIADSPVMKIRKFKSEVDRLYDKLNVKRKEIIAEFNNDKKTATKDHAAPVYSMQRKIVIKNHTFRLSSDTVHAHALSKEYNRSKVQSIPDSFVKPFR